MRKLIVVCIIVSLLVTCMVSTTFAVTVTSMDDEVDVQGTVKPGGFVDLKVDASGHAGAQAVISTEGLEPYSLMGESMSDHSELMLLSEYGSGMVTTYHYVVTAQPGETVSFTLSNVTVCDDGEEEYTEHDVTWSATVEQPEPDQVYVGSSGCAIVYDPTGITNLKLLLGLSAMSQELGSKFNTMERLSERLYYPEGTTVQAVTPDNTVRGMTELLCTGDRIQLLNNTGQVVDEITVIVDGDVLGTGLMQLSQLVRMAKHVRFTEPRVPLSGVYLLAGDLVGGGENLTKRDGTVSLADLVQEAHLLKQAREPLPDLAAD